MEKFIIVGRLSDGENHVKLVAATSAEEACVKFEAYLCEQEDDDTSDVYIDFCGTADDLESSIIE